MKTITEYHIFKSIDDKTKIHHIIKNQDGDIIYELSHKPSNNGELSLSPIDLLDASLEGKQIIIIPEYHKELQEMTFKLHLLNVCKSNNEKKELSFIHKLKDCLHSLFTMFISV